MSNKDCEYCRINIGSKKAKKLYEDELFIAFLSPKPVSDGHIVIIPKKHHTILEQIPDFEIDKLFMLANKLSIAVFDSLRVGGTNLIINNGLAAGQEIPHVALHIIPRNQGDNISYDWEPKKLNNEEISTVELRLKEGSSNVGAFEKKEEKPVDLDEKPEEKEKKKISDKDKENYLVKQLERIP